MVWTLGDKDEAYFLIEGEWVHECYIDYIIGERNNYGNS